MKRELTLFLMYPLESHIILSVVWNVPVYLYLKTSSQVLTLER